MQVDSGREHNISRLDDPTRARGGAGGAGAPPVDSGRVELQGFLEQLRIDPAHAEKLWSQGLSLAVLTRLSPEELSAELFTLGLPRGPLVRIRKAVELGLMEHAVTRLKQQAERAEIAQSPQAKRVPTPANPIPQPAATDNPWGKPKSSTAPPPGMPPR